MKHKHQQPRSIESNRTIGTLRPTTQRNGYRSRLTPEDRLTLWCICISAVASAVIVAVESAQ